jgi:hypothetical protein
VRVMVNPPVRWAGVAVDSRAPLSATPMRRGTVQRNRSVLSAEPSASMSSTCRGLVAEAEAPRGPFLVRRGHDHVGAHDLTLVSGERPGQPVREGQRRAEELALRQGAQVVHAEVDDEAQLAEDARVVPQQGDALVEVGLRLRRALEHGPSTGRRS